MVLLPHHVVNETPRDSHETSHMQADLDSLACDTTSGEWFSSRRLKPHSPVKLSRSFSRGSVESTLPISWKLVT